MNYGASDNDAKFAANDRALGLPIGTTRAQFMVESGMRGDAVSPAGARGWAQIMPATQTTLERRAGRKFDPSNLDDSIAMHRAVMGENLTKFGNLPDALRAYNGGWNREKWGNRETSAYPYKVLGQIDGQTINDTRPPTIAERYKKGGLMPASYDDDSDIFADLPRPKAKTGTAQAPVATSRQGIAPAADDGDLDIFADLPRPKKAAPAAASKRADPTLLERGMAVPAGFNKGLTTLAGLPVDTVANVLDLAKAGAGFAYNEGKKLVTGKPSAAPAWTEPFDRSQVVGTSEWIGKNINRAAAAGGVRSPIDNPRPDDAVSRILYSGGVVGGASTNPNPNARISAAQQALNASGGMVSGLVSGAVGEESPEWAGLAGMAPTVAARAGAASVRGAVRGREAGRRRMEQRIQDLRNGGIEEPSLGLASGRNTIMGLENLMSQTPGSVTLYQTAQDKVMAGMKGKAEGLRDQISPEFGAVTTGQAIQADLKGSFRDRINTTSRRLNDRVGQEVGEGYYTFPERTLSTARGLSAINPGAPATSQALRNGRIAGIADSLGSDVMGTPIPGNPLMNAPMRYRRADGVEMDTPPGIPFGTLKALRTSIGEEASSSAIMGTPEQGQFKRLYGSMSEDMRQAVNAADRRNAGVEVGPLAMNQQPAAIALNRANRHYSRAMNRAEELDGLANRSTPEGAYNAVAGSLNNGPTLFEKLRVAIDRDTRKKLVATIVDDMGNAKPGQQTADGEAWSPRTFLTNFSKLQESGGGEVLFKRLPGGEKHAAQLADIAKASEMVTNASKVWANPSGTSAATVSRGTLGALGVGAIFEPFTAAKVAAGLGLANQVSKRLLLNPKFVNWLAQAPKWSRKEQQVQLQRVVVNAELWGGKELKADVNAYVNAVQAAQQQEE